MSARPREYTIKRALKRSVACGGEIASRQGLRSTRLRHSFNQLLFGAGFELTISSFFPSGECSARLLRRPASCLARICGGTLLSGSTEYNCIRPPRDGVGWLKKIRLQSAHQVMLHTSDGIRVTNPCA